MAQSIAIFGAGGFGREVFQIILDINAQNPEKPVWMTEGFLVDPEYVGVKVQGLPTLNALEWLRAHPATQVVVAVGSSVQRRRIVEKIKAASSNTLFATLVHPRAWIGRGVKLGDGCVVCAGSLLTTDIGLGDHVHVNIGATIGHDAALADYVTLNPSVNVSGNVKIGEGCEIGTGSVLIPQLSVGQWSIAGAASVITKSVPANVTVVGAPAKVIKERVPGWHEAVV